VLLAAGLQALAVAWAPLRDLLGTEPLPLAGLAAVVLLAAVPGLAVVRRGR
jgi:P-type Ca2+ transporter type 2C